MNQHTPSLADIEFLTVAEVAAVLRVSKMTVYRMIHNGELESIRIGRSFRVPNPAFKHVVQHGTSQPETRLPRPAAPGGFPRRRLPGAAILSRF
jgi:excisionase family DNA binding protein